MKIATLMRFSEVFDRIFLAHASGCEFHAKSCSAISVHGRLVQLALEAH